MFQTTNQFYIAFISWVHWVHPTCLGIHRDISPIHKLDNPYLPYSWDELTHLRWGFTTEYHGAWNQGGSSNYNYSIININHSYTMGQP
jgi:hypothetical protein